MGKSKKRQRSAEDEAATEGKSPYVASLPTKKAKLDSGEPVERKSESHDLRPADASSDAAAAAKKKKSKKDKKIKKESQGQDGEDATDSKEAKKEKKEKKDKTEKKEKKDQTEKKKAKQVKEEKDTEDQAVEETVGLDKEKKKNKERKTKIKKEEEDETLKQDDKETEGPKGAEEKKSKKDKKREKKDGAVKDSEEFREDQENGTNGAEDDSAKQSNDGAKRNKFIAFIGNLPYTATLDDVKAHFASLRPVDVRLLMKKENPTKSRGIAFVEFDRFDRMKTCLEKFHHSDFNDGKSAVRKINVELTAGGGGNTQYRKDKIKDKNAKLNEERRQRMAKEEAAKSQKAKEKKEPEDQTREEREEDQIHPSRRGRVPNHR